MLISSAGAVMILDQPEERGLAFIEERWGDPKECRFPLFSFLKPLSLEGMYCVHLIMLLGAAGICTGAFFKQSCLAFLLPYWFIFLLEKSRWNNHTYLYGLIVLLLSVTGANRLWSVDSWRKSVIRNTDIPRWNYALLRCQIFLVYFIAGLKKTDRDWIGGYSMEGLGQHWVFDLFKLVMTEEQVDAYVVHWGGFLLDLTVGFFMVASAVRPFGVLFCVLFNAMNSRMFAIGMFPYVMIVLTTVFFGYSWPKKLAAILPQYMRNMVPDLSPSRPDFLNCWYPGRRKVGIHSIGSRKVELRLRRWKMTAFLVCLHVLLQLFLPYSHGITKGYNTWTQGSYGYSWDMMVHNWRPVHVKLVLYDNATHRAHFVDPEKFTTSRRWYHQADMVVQFAHCIRDRVQQDYGMKDIEIYVDVWMSLNGRFAQRMYDPMVNILEQPWSPFVEVPWVLPVLRNFSEWRESFKKVRGRVHAASTLADVEFIADFPGFTLINYIGTNFDNASLEVLNGTVAVSFPSMSSTRILHTGESTNIFTGVYHTVTPLKHAPAGYMYVYAEKFQENDTDSSQPTTTKREIISSRHFKRYMENWKISLQRIANITTKAFKEKVFRKALHFLERLMPSCMLCEA
ncbi:gamma-glutamyl carboxylase [Rhipicephalus microplus]|uniref:gamma-glutamyl carboxylase n=1 Tax=Rhipicephalus microplus TaxID=6941 RepID=UPI003F6A9A90